MKELAAYEAKTRLSALLVEVEKGEQFLITRRGWAVARLVPAAPEGTRSSRASTQSQQVADTFTALNALRADTSLDLPVRGAIEQGRD